jgi:hypothetical protein
LVASAAIRINNKKKTQATLGQTQKQTGKQRKQGKHYNVNNASQLNNPWHLKGQGRHHGYMHYNFCRIHVWSLDEVIALLE